MPLALALLVPRSIFFVLLVRPDNAPTLSPAEGAEIQKGHLAHLGKLGADGHCPVAGPFENGGRFRGVVVLRAADAASAAALCADDPAVKAGRLKAEVHPWRVSDRAFRPYVDGASMTTLTVVLRRRGGPEKGAILAGRSDDGYSAISVLPLKPTGWTPRGDAIRLDWWCAKGILPGT